MGARYDCQVWSRFAKLNTTETQHPPNEFEMNIQKIAHIAIAVRSLDEQIRYYRHVLGLPLVHREDVAKDDVRVAMFNVGGIAIELLEPITETSPVAKFIAQRGEGIHHIAYEVDDVNRSLAELKAKGIKLVDEEARPGADGRWVGFLHPKATFGVLTEFCQSPKP